MPASYGIANSAIGAAFLSAYSSHDWGVLANLLAPEITWELPGHGRLSGRIEGAEAVLERVQLIVGGGTKTELLHVLVGQSGLALSLHNTGQREDGRVLDEHLVTLLRVRDGKIAAIETYLSDVPMMEAFFEDAKPAR